MSTLRPPFFLSFGISNDADHSTEAGETLKETPGTGSISTQLRPIPPAHRSNPTLPHIFMDYFAAFLVFTTRITSTHDWAINTLENRAPTEPSPRHLTVPPCANVDTIRGSCGKPGTQGCSACKLISYCSKVRPTSERQNITIRSDRFFIRIAKRNIGAPTKQVCPSFNSTTRT